MWLESSGALDDSEALLHCVVLPAIKSYLRNGHEADQVGYLLARRSGRTPWPTTGWRRVPWSPSRPAPPPPPPPLRRRGCDRRVLGAAEVAPHNEDGSAWVDDAAARGPLLATRLSFLITTIAYTLQADALNDLPAFEGVRARLARAGLVPAEYHWRARCQMNDADERPLNCNLALNWRAGQRHDECTLPSGGIGSVHVAAALGQAVPLRRPRRKRCGR